MIPFVPLNFKDWVKSLRCFLGRMTISFGATFLKEQFKKAENIVNQARFSKENLYLTLLTSCVYSFSIFALELSLIPGLDVRTAIFYLSAELSMTYGPLALAFYLEKYPPEKKNILLNSALSSTFEALNICYISMNLNIFARRALVSSSATLLTYQVTQNPRSLGIAYFIGGHLDKIEHIKIFSFSNDIQNVSKLTPCIPYDSPNTVYYDLLNQISGVPDCYNFTNTLIDQHEYEYVLNGPNGFTWNILELFAQVDWPEIRFDESMIKMLYNASGLASFESGKDIADKAIKGLSPDIKMTLQEGSAIVDYTHSSDINQFLRGQKDYVHPSLMFKMALMTSGLNKLSVSNTMQEYCKGVEPKNLRKITSHHKAFVSLSDDHSVCDVFSTPSGFFLKFKDAYVKAKNISAFSRYPNERELLACPSTIKLGPIMGREGHKTLYKATLT